jgi:CheY-specific phosphatase CheX
MKVTIEALLKALQHTLETMGSRLLEVGAAEGYREGAIHADVSAHVSLFNGSQLCAVMVASESAALALVRDIGGIETNFEDELVGDTVGELLNVAVGNAQEAGGYQFSTPVIVKGRKHEVRVLRSGYLERIQCTVAGGELSLYLTRAAESESKRPGNS